MPSGLALPYNQRLFGYSEQVSQVTQFCGTPPPERPTARALLTIEGPPGTGKSLFSVLIRKIAEQNGFRVCHTCVAKVNKFASYVSFRPIFYNFLLLAKSLCPSSDNNSHSSASSKKLQGSCTTPDHEVLPGSLMSMLRSVFTAMKEDEKKIPLLSGLLPSLTVPDNEWTKPASAKAREELVKKLVISIARFVEESVNLMVVVENLEWIDALSASLIRSIINRCPRIRVVLLTQSLNECDPVFRRYASREPTSPESVLSFHLAFSVPQHSKTVQLQLGKMPLENMEELIAWLSVLGMKDADGMEVDFEIRGVDKKLTNFVETKSGSIPLAISYVGAYLNAMNYMIVQPDGILALKETVSESVLADVHVSSFISWSFDRLPETARKSLQIASLISENRFAIAMLSELSQHVDGVAITEDEVIDLLASEHNLSFLIRLGSGKLREFEEEQYFSFRDPAVIPIIQCTIPPSSVSKLHLLIAQYYEKHNGTIAQIARHYMKTNPDDRSLDAKKATYLEILAAAQLKGSNLAETIQTLQTLDEMMNVNPALKSKMDRDGTRSSSLYYALGSCLIKSGQNLEGERHLRTALYYCGFKFPEHGAGVKKMVVQQAWVQQKNYHNLVSLNSTTPTPSPSPNTDRGLRRKVQLAIDCFSDLITAYFLLGKEMELLLISLWGLNACQQLGQATPYHAAFLAHAGNMLCFFHFHDIGHTYLHRSIAMNLPLARPHPSPFYVLAFDKFANGDWVGSHADQLLAIQYSRSFGVVTNTLAYYFASGPLVLLMTLRGDIAIAPPESAGLLDELEKVGKQNGDDEARLWAVFLKLLRVILLREDGCVPFADAWIPSNRIACLLRDMERNPASHKGDMNELTALGLLAAIDVRTGSNSSAFANIAKLKPLSKCLTNTSIIAYAGLSVSILALYEIIGSSRHMRMLASDRERLNSYAKDLESMCSILTPKYRFVNFSLYLAKAFPSFLTGQSVSRPGMTEKGISILLKGWKLLDVPPVASDKPSSVPSFSFSLFSQTLVEEPTPLSSTTSGSIDVTNSTTGAASPKGNLTVFDQIPLLKAHYLAILARYSSDLRPAEAKAWAFEARCALESVRLDPARFFDEEIEHTKTSPCASHASTVNTLLSTIKTGNLDSKPIGGLMARRRSSTGLGRRSSPLSTVL